MATIQERLSVLASSTERTEDLTAAQLAEEKKKLTVIDYKIVTFSLSGKDYGIDIMKVKEIAKAGHFTYVPNALPFVRGVYNLRGDIIPIIDLRLFFNCESPKRDDNYLENMLIVTVGEQTFGIVVDAIDKVIGIQKSSIQPPHPLFGDINIKYIYGVVEASQNLYILLDLDRIFGVTKPGEEPSLPHPQPHPQADVKHEVKEPVAEAKPQNDVKTEEKAVPASEKSDSQTEKKQQAPQASESVPDNGEDYRFLIKSLGEMKKFQVNNITEDWTKKRYEEWAKTKGKGKTQLQNDNDADAFLKPFYSACNQTWWSEEYADAVSKALPENSAKNIVVWNPGCGKGYESYSLACILAKKYPNAKIRVYGHDVDLLSVSNAPIMNLSDEASVSWYQPYTTKTVGGDYTFTKEIKDSIMFEYHDCVNADNLPPIDIAFTRDLLAFLPESSQRKVLDELNEKVKENGIIIVGDNENIQISGWSKKQQGSVSVYSK